MKLPVGFPFFNPPHVQKVTAVEEGNFFVPTEGVDGETTSEDLGAACKKTGKIIKGIVIALAIVAFIIIGVLAILDTGPV